MRKQNFDWKKYLLECMNSTQYCSLATFSNRKVWSNPVYFAWDDKYNLYFISQMSSRHMQNIKKNSHIAVSIYKTEQKGDVLGIQLEGTAIILSKEDSKEEIQHAYNTYYGRAGRGPDVQQYVNNPTWLYVKINPSKVWYFDTRFFGEKRQEVPLGKV